MTAKKHQITWVNFLHIYQPPWQQHDIINKVVDEAYRDIIKTLKKYPSYKITLNISGALTEQLAFFGFQDVLKDLAVLSKKGQIEFTASAKFHPILPLISRQQIIKQINDNHQTNKKYLPGYRPRGFYLPEMAYSKEAAEIIHSLGYKWLILDPISSKQKVNPTRVYKSSSANLKIIFRDHKTSNSFPPEDIFKLLKKNKNKIIVSATDGEIYGHFHQDWQAHLRQILESKKVACLTVSEFIKTQSSLEEVVLRSSSWQSTEKELKRLQPYALWSDKKNTAHRLAWKLANFAIKQIESHPKDPNAFWAQHHLDRGLSSCSFWWASEIKTSVFASLSWNPDEIDNGLEELIRSVRSLQKAPRKIKLAAEKLYIEAKKEIWTRHWKKYYAKN